MNKKTYFRPFYLKKDQKDWHNQSTIQFANCLCTGYVKS